MQSSGHHFTFETPESKIGEDPRQRDSGYHEEERLHSTPKYFTARVRRPTKLQFSAEKQKRRKDPVAVTHFYLKLVQCSIREGSK